MADPRRNTADGLLWAHARLSANQRKISEAASFLNRPVPCQGFYCRNERRIWPDFDGMIPNPAIEQADWPFCLSDDKGKKAPPAAPGAAQDERS